MFEYFIAFGAGLISFLSPCVLPLIPGYISYISGQSLQEVLNSKKSEIKHLPLEERPLTPYLPMMYNHPCTIWTRSSLDNFEWVHCYANALNDEYHYRYGKLHKSVEQVINKLPDPKNMPRNGLTPFLMAMPDELKDESNVIESYRLYYHTDKATFATKPFLGIQPLLLDDNGDEIKENNKVGKLCVKFPWPSIARTIWGNHERYINTYFSAFKGKYFTGDGAFRDENGNYRITGRVDDVIIVSGHNLGTAEIESAFVAHPKVAEAAVVGYPHAVSYTHLTLPTKA